MSDLFKVVPKAFREMLHKGELDDLKAPGALPAEPTEGQPTAQPTEAPSEPQLTAEEERYGKPKAPPLLEEERHPDFGGGPTISKEWASRPPAEVLAALLAHSAQVDEGWFAALVARRREHGSYKLWRTPRGLLYTEELSDEEAERLAARGKITVPELQRWFRWREAKRAMPTAYRAALALLRAERERGPSSSTVAVLVNGRFV
jgi:hypothetical protein